MNITPASAAAASQLKTQTELATRMLKKVLDVNTQQGADLANMIAQAGGVGQRIDLYA